nr:pimeloyl-ACP methyl ester esterase BioH [Aestuariibacter sp. A3R04]
MVLLHGWGMNSGVFEHFIPLLEQDFRITTIDLPGFGENNSYLPDTYSVGALAHAIHDILPHQSIVAGWSLGGMVAQQLAMDYPERVAALVTIASTPRFVNGPCWPGIQAELLAQFEAELARNYHKTLERFLAIQAMGSATAKQDMKAIKQSISAFPSPSEAALKSALNLLSTEDLRHQVGKIKQPTLRIYGRLDSLVPTSGIDRICELHPQSDTVVLPHASHAPFISHPQQSADIIRQFAYSA